MGFLDFLDNPQSFQPEGALPNWLTAIMGNPQMMQAMQGGASPAPTGSPVLPDNKQLAGPMAQPMGEPRRSIWTPADAPDDSPPVNPNAPQHLMRVPMSPQMQQPQAPGMSAMAQAPMPQPQQPQQPQPGGLGDGFRGMMANAHTGPIGMLLGAVGGAAGMGEGNVTLNTLMKRGGFDRETAMAIKSNPTVLANVMTQILGTKSARPLSADEKAKFGLQPNIPWLLGADGRPTLPEGYASIQPKSEKVGAGETLYSVPVGGGDPKPLISGGPEKPPAGYQWQDPKDPSKGLSPIANGPATHIPAETAGRIAMMETAQKDLPNAKDVLLKDRGPMGHGPKAAAEFYSGLGDVGRAKRIVRVGVEASLRAMTGAAAPETEVSRYEDMFMPKPLDSKETAQQKIDLLDAFMSKARATVTQGRVPVGDAQAAPSAAPTPAAGQIEGKTATGPNGIKIIVKDGKWVPYK